MRRAILAIALTAAPLLADEVHLRGGGKLTGEITEQTEEAVTIDIGAGTMTVRMSTVVGIDRGTSPLQEFRSRASTVADDDIESWRLLGRWATEQGLSAQADEAYSRVRKALPGDEEANRALGLVFYENRWITEEESFEARGFVKLGSEWMTPAERDAIIHERDAREAANREAVFAEVDASETERKEREAEEARRAEERAWRPQLPTVQSYNWGYGPTTWPNQPGGVW